MQLQDETIEYHFQGSMAPPVEAWTPLAELQAQHLLQAARLRALIPQLQQVRSQIAGERELTESTSDGRPLESGFIDYPQKTLEQLRRSNAASELGQIMAAAERLRKQADRVVVVGPGGSLAGARAIFGALSHRHHNELPPKSRMGAPRLYFAGQDADTDATQELLDLLETSCVDPELVEERWGLVVMNRTGDALEASTAYRLFRSEAARYYGAKNGELRPFIVPIAGNKGKFRELLSAEGFADSEILTIPENVGCKFSVFTAAGLLPAALLGLDVRALLLGAQAMTRRFLEEPFERNPVLQFAAVNALLAEDHGKRVRVMAIWSAKLAEVGKWYEQLAAEALGRQGRGPTPLTINLPQELTARGQLLQDGPRTAMINHLIVKSPKSQPIAVGMSDHNEDELNQFSRRTLPDLNRAAHAGWRQVLVESGRPTADLVLPALNEVTLGQLMQLLMLATIVEARLTGVNPYGQPAAAAPRRYMHAVLKSMATPTA